MTPRVLAVVAAFLPALACAGGHAPVSDTHSTQAVPPSEPAIRVTINPEARVSVALVGALPAPAPCGTAADLPVRIVNLGFVTATLEAELVGDVPPGVTLDFQPEPLRGVREERRMLHITLRKAGTVDLTVAFRTRNEIPDLGGRDRIHFLMRCK